MKWKLTGRYLLSILSIVLIVIFVNTFILFGMVVIQQTRGMEGVRSDSAETFTRGFSQYITLTGAEPTVSEAGLKALEEYGAWLQIVDGYGRVLSSHMAPDSASDHYTLMDVVHKYKYMDDEFNTYFLGEIESFSYIIGIPYAKEQRVVFTLDVASMLSLASKSLFAIAIVDLIIAAIIGLLFSTILTKPVDAIIQRIAQLKQRRFEARVPKRPGIFRTVFSNLNDVSETLMKHEQERLTLETMRDEWITNVSHDLKTPLASIQGYAELLSDEYVPADERVQYAEVIERQSIYMKDLLDDFQLTMRLRNQEMTLQLQQTRIEIFVKEMLIDLLNDPQFRGREVTFTSEAPELSLSIDQHLIKRALLNFVHNALVHNEHDTSVAVIVTNECMLIEDDGKGIAAEHLDQIFDRYYRGTNTANSIGAGLGMAIARDIVEAHGMTVELTSQAGEGTTIKITYGNES